MNVLGSVVYRKSPCPWNEILPHTWCQPVVLYNGKHSKHSEQLCLHLLVEPLVHFTCDSLDNLEAWSPYELLAPKRCCHIMAQSVHDLL